MASGSIVLLKVQDTRQIAEYGLRKPSTATYCASLTTVLQLADRKSPRCTERVLIVLHRQIGYYGCLLVVLVAPMYGLP